MKRTALRTRKVPDAPADFGFARWSGDLADTFEEYASESLVDYEDEREVVEEVVHGTTRVSSTPVDGPRR